MKLKNLVLTVLLGIAAVFCTVNYIYLQHMTRNVFSELQNHVATERSLNTDWGKLQIEHSTLVAVTRIERIAKTSLEMFLPNDQQITQIKR